MRTYIPQQEKFDTFSDLVKAASSRYTLSFRDACKALKCSRSWAQNYIRPNVPSIYLQNGKGTGKANYARLVSLAIQQQENIDEFHYSNESVYLDREAFVAFIYNSISSCQKRSKRIYKTYFIQKENLTNYYSELLVLYQTLTSGIAKKEIEGIWEQINILYLKYAENEFVKDIIHPAIIYPTKRTAAPFIEVPIPNTPIEDWMAIHDLMDYGDIEETHYRNLFQDGCIRIELKIPDKNGEIKSSGKVFYLPDPAPVLRPSLSQDNIQYILRKYDKESKETAKKNLAHIMLADAMNIKQSAWLEYNNMLGKNITY